MTFSVQPVYSPANPRPSGRTGIEIEIGDGPITRRVDPIESADEVEARAAAAAARAQAAEELKPAPWAAAIEGTNQKKGWGAAIDKTGLDECPICLEESADVKMEPCGHTCCGKCLDQWMSTKASFAQTLRTGSSDTTCPLCRAAVTDTTAATPVEGAAAAASSAAPSSNVKDEDDVKELMALSKQRQAELVATARAMREPPPVPAAVGKQAPSVPDAAPPKSEPAPPKPEPKPSNTGSAAVRATYHHPNHTSWSSSSKPGKKRAPEDRGARNSDGADVDAMLGDAMQARSPEPGAASGDDPWTQEEKHRRKEHEEAKAHAAWVKAQMSATKATETKGAPGASHAPQGVPASGGVSSAQSADQRDAPLGLGGGAKRLANEGWDAVPGNANGFATPSAFRSGFGGGLGAKIPSPSASPSATPSATPSAILSSDIPSDIPSDFLSTNPSDIPSAIPRWRCIRARAYEGGRGAPDARRRTAEERTSRGGGGQGGSLPGDCARRERVSSRRYAREIDRWLATRLARYNLSI